MTHKKIAIYCRVSTDDQDAERQVHDLLTYAHSHSYEVVGIFRETASGAKNDRAERAKVLELAKRRKIKAILITELSRWGRSVADLIHTAQELESYGVSLVPLNGDAIDWSTPMGKLFATILAAIAEFERDLLIERTKSGLRAARAKGRIGGRKPGQNITQDKYREQILDMQKAGESVRGTASKLGISPGVVQKVRKAAN